VAAEETAVWYTHALHCADASEAARARAEQLWERPPVVMRLLPDDAGAGSAAGPPTVGAESRRPASEQV
jgi:hypothetical protein